MKSGNLNFLEPSGPLQASNRTALPFTHDLQISHSVDCASWYTCIIKINMMHFSFLIYFSNCLLMMNSYFIQNMQRIDYWNKLRKKSASYWSLLRMSYRLGMCLSHPGCHGYHCHGILSEVSAQTAEPTLEHGCHGYWVCSEWHMHWGRRNNHQA